jgi:hypothetical protein
MGAAVWVAGKWLAPGEVAGCETPNTRADLSTLDTLGSTRIARADRLTRIAAGVAARAFADALVDVRSDGLAVLVASCLASAHTNEGYERRRQRTGKAGPRDFPYTAPNAWGGELSAALGARGPCASYVGGADAGLIALTRAQRWLEAGLCPAALVVAAECPPDATHLVAPAAVSAVEAAAAVILVPAAVDSIARLQADFTQVSPEACRSDHVLLAVGPIARVALAARGEVAVVVTAKPAVGAAVRVRVTPTLRYRGTAPIAAR